jgi:hypothetical protein
VVWCQVSRTLANQSLFRTSRKQPLGFARRRVTGGEEFPRSRAIGMDSRNSEWPIEPRRHKRKISLVQVAGSIRLSSAFSSPLNPPAVDNIALVGDGSAVVSSQEQN